MGPESLPARDQCLTTVPHNQLNMNMAFIKSNSKDSKSGMIDNNIGLLLGYFLELEIGLFGLLFASSWRPDFKKTLPCAI